MGDSIYAEDGADDVTYWADSVSWYWRHIRLDLSDGLNFRHPRIVEYAATYNMARNMLRAAVLRSN